MSLPQLSAPLTVTDGGLETTLVYGCGIDLPDFAAFPLLDTEAGRAALAAYYEPYLALGRRRGGPTWSGAHASATTRFSSLRSTGGPSTSYVSSPPTVATGR